MFARSFILVAAVLASVAADVRSLYTAAGSPNSLGSADDLKQLQLQQVQQLQQQQQQQEQSSLPQAHALLQTVAGGSQASAASGTPFSQGALQPAVFAGPGGRADGGASQSQGPLQGVTGGAVSGGVVRQSGALVDQRAVAGGAARFDSPQLALQPTPGSGGAVFIAGAVDNPAEVTITTDMTIDRFTTLTNLAYNSVPVTLTEFVKVTLTAPTFQTVTTPVDDMVLVSRVPVTRIDTITVTDTNTGHQYATEVSTVLYTITHKLYDIRQQTITSLVVQTQLVRPRVVSTRIETEYETQTQLQTVTNTVLLDAQVPLSGPVPTAFGARYGSYQ